MAEPVVSRADLMAYCRVDTDEGGNQLMTLQSAAIDYLKVAGADHPDRPAYALAVKALVLHWYDHPDGGEAFSGGLRAVINQLKFS